MFKDSAVGELEARTLIYWHISRCWNGVAETHVTTEEALDRLNQVINNSNPGRPVNSQAHALRWNIIIGGKSSNGNKQAG